MQKEGISESEMIAMQAIELVDMAEIGLLNVEGVYEAYRKFRKYNPMIAYQNTRIADKENIVQYENWAIEGMDKVKKIPKRELEQNPFLGELMQLLLKSYEKESEALKRRLDIYDTHLLEDAEQLRNERILYLQAYAEKGDTEYTNKLEEILYHKAKIKMKIESCNFKIAENKANYQWHSHAIFWKKQARRTMQQAQNYMKEQQYILQLLEVEQKLAETNLTECVKKYKIPF